MTTRNPKQADTLLFDCIPQIGPCPINCNACFYNRPGAYYVPIDRPHVPTPEEVGNDGIVRMNCGNDSNNQRDLVIETARKYRRFFFNTSIPRYDFPGPVVLTANPKEEEPCSAMPIWQCGDWYSPASNLMFVRLRTSATNIYLVDQAAAAWTAAQVPVVITMMAYYDREPEVPVTVRAAVGKCYEWRTRHINSYYCPTKPFMRWVMDRYRHNHLVSMCGGLNSAYCRDCRNCETYFLQAEKRLRGE